MPATPSAKVDNNPATYGKIEQDNQFTYDSGLVALPVASREPAHVVIRLHGGYGMRRIKWSTDRRGAPPLIPAAVNTGCDTLLSFSITPQLPTPNREAQGYDWSISGEYLYVQNDPRVPGINALPVGQYPFPVLPANQVAQNPNGSMNPLPFTAFNAYLADPKVDTYDSGASSLLTNLVVNPDGTPQWPFLVIPAEMSTTTTFGG